MTAIDFHQTDLENIKSTYNMEKCGSRGPIELLQKKQYFVEFTTVYCVKSVMQRLRTAATK